ncbi:ArsR/SmtB family transcription factor [Flavobacterium aquidurense]|uniref:Rhodanese-related sulfurtransferase n=2 Tax=Flavobacterium TaxID=237 RepID=A0A7W7IW60_9FLAO|nr:MULTISPECIES: metalloregulator ArsR/SmtB family transcription factor [Flavobacterium]MBB4801696.1 rhodanese-related sulfurtransferase [Flavobacterium nitrogenifigens]MBB6386654.1 rhodanese-related sulfurtransferase [Flavobacterium notoginsengisoli]
MNKREFKDKVYIELSKAVKALANPHRLEIIDLLAQGQFTVEQIANNTGLSVANASQHLQNLKNAKLVQINRKGNFINYSLASEQIYNALICVRELGMTFNAEVKKVISDFRNGQQEDMRAIDAETLVTMLENDEVILLDVRPEEEYSRGHIHRALSTPIDKLGNSLKKIPKRKMLVAYCRGPFCVYADEAVAILTQKGYNAVRLEEGYPEWALKGYPVEHI